MNDIVERLRSNRGEDWPRILYEAADEIERLRKATGGLDPALVAKALNDYRIFLEVEPNVALTDDEIAAFRSTSFEVPE